MRIISKATLRCFWGKHKDAQEPLNKWFKITRRAQWHCSADVRKIFNSADLYKQFVIFNIAGNRYRLVVKIEYNLQIIFVKKVMTHAEYSKNKWKSQLL